MSLFARSVTRVRRFARVFCACVVAAGLPVAAAQQDPEPTTAGSQPTKQPTRPPLSERWSNAKVHFKEDAVYLVTFPKRRTPRGINATSAVLGGVFVLVILDDAIRERVQEARNDSLDRWESRIEPLGRGETTVLGSALVYLGGRLSHSENVTETGRSLLESLLFTQLFTLASKGAFGRSPPDPGTEANEFFEGDTVFPSGHTSRAFAVATVLAERHGKVAAWIAYPLAALVGFFRVESDSHWASDVLAGAALGHGVAKAVVRLRGARAGQEKQVTFVPTFSPGNRRAGFVLRITF